MSFKQLIILSVVVVGLVVLITFATQYLGGNRNDNPGPTPPGPVKHLVFEKTRPDPKKDPPAIHERNKAGHLDFRFENKSGGPVQLGLTSKNCQCSKVEVCVLSEEQWAQLDTRERERPTDAMEATLQPLNERKDDRKGVTVPAGAAGWVRLGWKNERLGQESLRVELWTQASSGEMGNPPPVLEVPVLFVDPVFCVDEKTAQDPLRSQVKQDDKDIGKLGAGESASTSFLCFSLTRPDFDLVPAESKTPCVVIEKPVKLSADELKELTRKFNPAQGDNKEETGPSFPVLCAYRLVVTVREHADDKNQLDLGVFRYPLRLKIGNDLEITPHVLGEVEGPVTVEPGEYNQAGRISLRQFRSSQEQLVPIQLFANDRQLELKLDGERTRATPFFHVTEVREIPQKTGKTWEVSLKIPANTVEGVFPDRSKNPKPGYEDCAVYLLVRKKPEAGAKEEPWRRIRIPIYGNATR